MGAGVPGPPHPTPWPRGMWAQGGKWVRAGLELNPIGPMTSLPAPEEAWPQVACSLLQRTLRPFSSERKKLGTLVSGQEELEAPQWTEERSPHNPGWRLCTKQTAPPPHPGTGSHLEHWLTSCGRLGKQTCSSFQGAEQVRAGSRRGRAHGQTDQSRRVFYLVRLQPGKLRNPSP